MPRPRLVRSTNPAAIRKYFRETQAQRSAILELFMAQLKEDALLREVKTDDALFAGTLQLASEEYGVRFQDIAEKIGMSAAAVGRWAKQINLPVSAIRPLVVQTIAELLEDHVQRQKKADVKRGVYMN